MSARGVFRFVVFMAVATVLAGCDDKKPAFYQGWVEADLIFVSPDEAGRLETQAVKEGDHVEKGAPLFTLDAELQQADVMQFDANVKNAMQNLERARALLRTNAGTQKAFQDAEETLRTAQARLNSAKTRLARRRAVSPVSGSVQQIYFRPGEMVAAGKPVLALLPPENTKVRFYVPESLLPKLSLDAPIAVGCDGCPPDLAAHISFISRTAEYTPPVIYSLEERNKLVFLIEARPDRPDTLRVGQPVSVRIADNAS